MDKKKYSVDHWKLVKHPKFTLKHDMCGYCEYPGKGIISDEAVFQLVKRHSRLVDRLSLRKMVEMSIAGQLILMGIYESEGWYSDQADWTFYGKDGFFTLASKIDSDEGHHEKLKEYIEE